MTVHVRSVVEMLLEHDCPSDAETDEQLATVNVSVADIWLDTPLHLAAQGGHCTVAVTLLGKGACVSARLAVVNKDYRYIVRGFERI